MGQPVKDLHDVDFYAWTSRSAELLRSGRLEEADIARIAEELEDMGKRERHELESRLRVLLTHLLKWQIQTQRRSGSRQATINTQRKEIRRLLRAMPSLCNALRSDLSDVYDEAMTKAIGETGLGKSAFPQVCPFDLDQILDTGFFPD